MSLKILTDGDIGKWVEYRDHDSIQKGRLKSFNGSFAFVVFHCDDDWDNYRNYTGCACCLIDLNFTEPLEIENNDL